MLITASSNCQINPPEAVSSNANLIGMKVHVINNKLYIWYLSKQ
jgi:hypothetical protein